MIPHRRLSVAAALFAVGTVPALAAYPERPVRLIVGFSAGGGTDIAARLLAKQLTETWGKSVVVDNRPGADGSIGSAIVAKANPDGHTIVMVTNAHTITPSISKLPYDPIRDFEPITQIATVPNLLMLHPSVRANDVRELIALAKKEPGKLSFGSSGGGTTPYFAMEKFKQMADIDMVHVPYKGTSPAVLALLGGQIQLLFGGVSATLSHHRSGKLRAIAVSSRERNKAVPELPTVAESGLPGFEAYTWYAWLAPAGTPRGIIAIVHRDVVAALGAQEVQLELTRQGFTAVGNTPSEVAAIIRNEIADWARVVRNTK